MSFIDASYFVGELDIPNSGEPAIAERITLFINKYEPLFLQKLMGYPLYKAFITGLNVIPPATPDIRWLNILYGAEYTDRQGFVAKWKGLIVTDNPIYNLAGGYTYRKPEYLTAGETAGFPAGVNTVILDGTLGAPDLRGWTPILTRTEPMRPGIDYSWDVTTGVLTLLQVGDKFGQGEFFLMEFELRTDPVLSTGLVINESCITNYVYYWLRRNSATQTAGIGEVITNAENSTNISPRKKMASARNEMRVWVREFLSYMEQSAATYPEWTYTNENDALKYFSFMNPIF